MLNLFYIFVYALRLISLRVRLRVNLTNAKLDCVGFERVDLTEANLTGAWDADVDKCILCNTIMPDGSILSNDYRV
ncbi:MAG: pentapeptide repeat-containing protein [Nostoc sp.]|uniref:pentapeptide repeat-containing protein n=1 Tax=Nostoc sp. TaxID=1180 RepID=UPI002FF45E4A